MSLMRHTKTKGNWHISFKEIDSFFLQLFEVIWVTTTNPGETLTQSCAEKYEGFFCTLPHEILLSMTKVRNEFTGSINR